MKVSVKKFDLKLEVKNLEVKNKGVEFEIRDTKNKFLGDCVVTRTGLTWCKGKTSLMNGKKVQWDKFIEWMESP